MSSCDCGCEHQTTCSPRAGRSPRASPRPAHSKRQVDSETVRTVKHVNPGMLADSLLNVIENEVVPLTERGVENGNKLFGAAICGPDFTRNIAGTNNEFRNPLFHGEVSAIFNYFDLPEEERPGRPDECVFFATHEPCPLCLSSIAWTGFKEVYYLFTYEDTRDAFAIPHDLKILESVFKCPNGSYNRQNDFFRAKSVAELIAEVSDEEERAALQQRVEVLRVKYDELSAVYQQKKSEGKTGNVILG
mmetsp:Transcript_1484/g.2449  ORF Transcript_1484/g.2449 Transcript_1484/m.2449 type:complete len:247 (+) Transcript_1484:281-1021(+)|eukprot:CAMPEP_0184295568 /NCGR_PEP_ID=MMETSP1049-20130417/6411_1 /TAXON_ID=77928 /ORGANISM="Proteomonas sulcata, Strain CCMP704" /LENGTH=246 /DNA_ID=CAMNT_0026604161 /DNA_START=256 /DNA_END=996 /DNA_ORIENTATION=+